MTFQPLQLYQENLAELYRLVNNIVIPLQELDVASEPIVLIDMAQQPASAHWPIRPLGIDILRGRVTLDIGVVRSIPPGCLVHLLCGFGFGRVHCLNE